MSWKDFFRRPKRGYYYGDYYGDYYEKPSKREETLKQNENNRVAKPLENIVDKKTEQPEKVIKADVSNELGTYFDTKSEKSTEGFKNFRPLYREKKDIIIFVVENSFMTVNYKNEILGLINKIVQSNKECFFMMLKVGNDKKFFDALDYEAFTTEKITESLLNEAETEVNIDYLEAINHIETFYNSIILDFEYKEKKYDIKNVSIIFVGTGQTSSDKEGKKEISRLIKRFKTMTKMKTIKYFCMEDNQTFNAAKLGMPVIGHIVTDFYK